MVLRHKRPKISINYEITKVGITFEPPTKIKIMDATPPLPTPPKKIFDGDEASQENFANFPKKKIIPYIVPYCTQAPFSEKKGGDTFWGTWYI